MDLGALDGALGPWRREREAAAWARYSSLRAQEKQLRHAAHVARLTARSELGALGEHVSGAAGLEAQADRCRARATWWRVCRLAVRRYEERRAKCGREWFEGECQHCGLCHAWPKACGATVVCADCARRKSKRLFRQLHTAVRLQEARAMAKWHSAGRPTGQRPVLTLMTMTVRSVTVDDLGARRKLLSDAWNRFRSWYQATQGRKLSYAWTAECTDGARNQGNVHLHVITLLPFVDYKVLGDAWKRAVGEQGGSADFQRRAKDAKAAARYVAKYASKGVKFSSVQTAAAWVRAQHGRRGVSTSRDFWWTDPIEHGPWVLRIVPARETVESDKSDNAHEVDHHGEAERSRDGPAP